MLTLVGQLVARIDVLLLGLMVMGVAAFGLARLLRDPYRVWRCRRTTDRIRRSFPVPPVVPPVPRQRREPVPVRIEVRPLQVPEPDHRRERVAAEAQRA
ncbi:hypothetical protein GCM10012275_42330 [Longimycelium tulufanense]|uniref:Uncharacterized protein n=1 Tax=Longimycelium tulufanense TaxID=907463 RepID=A0A8J3CHH5_9PSEU|nr:hypothetical protein [Longimycelium tulufanense]GGM67299.1 hypothetical protein GCM10012275_42330 [Longimycelium tulufanense]